MTGCKYKNICETFNNPTIRQKNFFLEENYKMVCEFPIQEKIQDGCPIYDLRSLLENKDKALENLIKESIEGLSSEIKELNKKIGKNPDSN